MHEETDRKSVPQMREERDEGMEVSVQCENLALALLQHASEMS